MIDVKKARTLIEIDADTSGARREIKKLTDDEKKAADARAKHAKDGSSAMGELVAGYAKGALAAASFGKAAEFAWDTLNQAIEHSKLSLAVANVDLERVSKSALGLKTNMELMRESARLNAGEWKLTTGELAAAQGAMRGLELRGIDAAKATEIVTKALVDMKLDGLNEVGIGLDAMKFKTETASGRMDQFAENLRIVNQLADEAARTGLLAGESWKQGAVDAKNAWEEFKVSLVTGDNILTFGAKQAAAMRRLGYLGDDIDITDAGAMKRRLELIEAGYDEEKMAEAVRTMDAIRKLSDSLLRDTRIVQGRRAAQLAADLTGAIAGAREAGMRSQGGGGDGGGVPAGSIRRYTGPIGFGDTIYGSGSASLGDGGLYSDVTSGMLADAASQRATERWSEQLTNIRALTEARETSALQGLFGPLTEFDAYRQAWEALTGTMQTAYGAIVDGEKSAGTAVKAFLKDTLKAMGSRMAIRALEEVAEGFAALANPNPVWGSKSAASHFLAAAKFGAGAVAAGVAASQISVGGGAANGSNAPGGGVPSYSGNRQQNGGGTTTVVVYGNDYSMDTARQRQLRAAKVLEDARQSGVTNGAVSYA